MAKFFETQMGRMFFEGMVPRLVHALESIAASLELIAEERRSSPPPTEK